MISTTPLAIAARRLHHQGLTASHVTSPAAVVSALGAVQAQEFPFARWGVALRMAGAVSDADILRAFNEGRILRTHVLRPTWHFVTPADIRWMLALTAPRIHRSLAGYLRRHELDTLVLTRAAAIIEKALAGANYLTRRELGARLARRGIAVDGIRLAFVAIYAELEGVICSGPWRKSVPTYALLEERARRAKILTPDEALAELTRRFFASHGPATIRDFVWWSGVRTADAKRGLEIIRARPIVANGLTYWSRGGPAAVAAPRSPSVRLLPIYDEYLVAYRDRDTVPHGPSTMGWAREAVTFRHAVVIDGQVAGTWNVSGHVGARVVQVTMIRRLAPPERRALETESARYGAFLGGVASLVIK